MCCYVTDLNKFGGAFLQPLGLVTWNGAALYVEFTHDAKAAPTRSRGNVCDQRRSEQRRQPRLPETAVPHDVVDYDSTFLFRPGNFRPVLSSHCGSFMDSKQ